LSLKSSLPKSSYSEQGSLPKVFRTCAKSNSDLQNVHSDFYCQRIDCSIQLFLIFIS